MDKIYRSGPHEKSVAKIRENIVFSKNSDKFEKAAKYRGRGRKTHVPPMDTDDRTEGLPETPTYRKTAKWPRPGEVGGGSNRFEIRRSQRPLRRRSGQKGNTIGANWQKNNEVDGKKGRQVRNSGPKRITENQASLFRGGP